MTNRDKLSKQSFIDVLYMISNGIEDCLYQVLSDCNNEQKSSRCKKMDNCYNCLSLWLNEGGKKMYLGNKWYEECEVQAEVKQLQRMLQEQQEELTRAKALLAQIRCYFMTTSGWDMYEDDVLALITKKQEGDAK